jgi:hypothetical protein
MRTGVMMVSKKILMLVGDYAEDYLNANIS